MEIDLGRGMVTQVDDDDCDWLLDFGRWNARRQKGYWYARTVTNAPNRRHVYMHRLILGEPKGLQVDHKDGDGLNNRRSNLRLADGFQNAANRRMQSNNRSGVVGVYQRAGNGPWVAQIRVHRKTIYLGAFPSLEEAATVRRAAEVEHFGEFAPTNPSGAVASSEREDSDTKH